MSRGTRLQVTVFSALAAGIVATRTEAMSVESNDAVSDSANRGEGWHSRNSRHHPPGPPDEVEDPNYSTGPCRLSTIRLHNPD